jgi:hypothetical protein
MKISEAFAGSFLKAADLPQPRVLTMQTVVQEMVGEEKQAKLVLRFHGEQRGLVLNKVNSIEIAGWYGDDTRSWTGQPVELYSTTTFFSGRQVPCIRVRRPAMQQPMQYPVPAPAPQYMPAPQQMQAPQPQQAAAPLQAPNVPFDA